MKRAFKMAGAMTGIMGMLYGMGIPPGEGVKNKLLGLLCMQRPAIAIMGPLMFLSAATLAKGSFLSLQSLIFGFIAVYLLSAAEHSIDDTIDMEIDRVKWPTRPLPQGVIKRSTSAVYAVILSGLGIIISFMFFNWQLVVVELVALALGTLYPFLRNMFGYLVLAPIPPLIAIGGWVAFSPDTLLTSPVPWALYMVFFFWQAFHILTLPWAINVAKTFIVRPKPKTVVILSVVFSVFTLVFSLYLASFISHWILFTVTMVTLSMAFWFSAVPLLMDPASMEKSLIATMVATNYNVFMCLALIWLGS